MGELPAGWYPDQVDETVERLWDGTRWTVQTRTSQNLSQPPDDAVAVSSSSVLPRKKQKRQGLILFGITALVLTCFFITRAVMESGPALPKPIQIDNGDPGMAWVMCKQRMSQLLKAPATAGFPLSNEFQIRQNGRDFIMDAWVDADNAFGARIRTNFQCATHYDGSGIWTTKIIAG